LQIEGKKIRSEKKKRVKKKAKERHTRKRKGTVEKRATYNQVPSSLADTSPRQKPLLSEKVYTAGKWKRVEVAKVSKLAIIGAKIGTKGGQKKSHRVNRRNCRARYTRRNGDKHGRKDPFSGTSERRATRRLLGGSRNLGSCQKKRNGLKREEPAGRHHEEAASPGPVETDNRSK